MSRIGKQPVQVPTGVTVNVTDSVFSARSSKGELTVPIPAGIAVSVDGSTVNVSPASDDKNVKPLWGLTRALINNAVVGLSEGWTKVMELDRYDLD